MLATLSCTRSLRLHTSRTAAIQAAMCTFFVQQPMSQNNMAHGAKAMFSVLTYSFHLQFSTITPDTAQPRTHQIKLASRSKTLSILLCISSGPMVINHELMPVEPLSSLAQCKCHHNTHLADPKALHRAKCAFASSMPNRQTKQGHLEIRNKRRPTLCIHLQRAPQQVKTNQND